MSLVRSYQDGIASHTECPDGARVFRNGGRGLEDVLRFPASTNRTESDISLSTDCVALRPQGTVATPPTMLQNRR